MAGHCCGDQDCAPPDPGDRRYRRVLWAALGINAAMFVVEIVASAIAGSSALRADALDFLADAGNYGVSLFVAGMALRYRARAALAKGATMGAFGVWVMASTLWHAVEGTLPHAGTIGAIGLLAFLANASVLGLLWVYRHGDANMRSVWVCSRNDVLANVAVMAAALGVAGTGTPWPDIAVAAVIGGLALQGAVHIIRSARVELRQPDPAPAE
ncbi:MAG: cobalt transporter [Rhodospirillaceae bacterium]|nr:cobalt transporter [Rhodospirillaceae bacterium]